MQAIVIDINGADAYLALPDGTNLNIAATQLPSKVKAGQSISLIPSGASVTNHRPTALF